MEGVPQNFRGRIQIAPKKSFWVLCCPCSWARIHSQVFFHLVEHDRRCCLHSAAAVARCHDASVAGDPHKLHGQRQSGRPWGEMRQPPAGKAMKHPEIPGMESSARKQPLTKDRIQKGPWKASKSRTQFLTLSDALVNKEWIIGDRVNSKWTAAAGTLKLLFVREVVLHDSWVKGCKVWFLEIPSPQALQVAMLPKWLGWAPARAVPWIVAMEIMGTLKAKGNRTTLPNANPFKQWNKKTI